jgi:uncharacterized protein (TIGR02453 family)
MTYFSPDYLEFFKELAANNNKDWFDRNRKRYETVVREPFKHFIGQLISEMAKSEPELDIEPKDAIFRINRDIRFSKDKTPYKLNNSAIVSPAGRKDKNNPGIYLEFGPERLGVYGGIYMPSPAQVQKVRSYIQANIAEWESVVNAPEFKEAYGEIEGEKSKRIPKEFRQAAEKHPLLYNKQWYYHADLSPNVIIGESLMDTVLGLWKKAYPVKNFLSQAIQS